MDMKELLKGTVSKLTALCLEPLVAQGAHNGPGFDYLRGGHAVKDTGQAHRNVLTRLLISGFLEVIAYEYVLSVCRLHEQFHFGRFRTLGLSTGRTR